jgi:GNAT superfamily N-acetyltransferase
VVTADVSARLAWPDDAAAIARVQVTAWRADYTDVLGEAVVATLDVDAVAAQWAASLTSPPEARMRVLVALERATVHGYAVVHPNADPDADPVGDGEIGELVVDPVQRGAGHGSRLLQAAIDTLAADKFTRARWWMPADNDGLRAFATSAGWAPDGAHRSVEDEAGTVIKQVRLHTALVS